jgi:hypothetical protein
MASPRVPGVSAPATTGRAARRRRARLARLTRPRTAGGFPLSVHGLTAALGLTGVAAGIVARSAGIPSRPISGLAVTGLIAMLTAAGALQVQFQYRNEEEALDLF